MKVLVTVAIAEGSVPREPGARMLVDATSISGTIGGGHLELKAIETARKLLEENGSPIMERYALGPSLGQCCGGVVHLAFECVEQWDDNPVADYWRLVALDGEAHSTVQDIAAFPRTRGTHVFQEADGRRWLADLVETPRNHLVLFGAGHVGAAIVRALADLPCRVTWVDEREDMFPGEVAANVTVFFSDAPEEAVALAPDGASYLVLTHSHALDQRLTETIMARDGVGWFGLIGSHTKRTQFERRLRARGVDDARIASMVCPIGIPGITSKLPAAIAASVVAQLLTVWEDQARAASPVQQNVRLVATARP
jgi:xanthine dehydrogenase accessory factor